MSQMAVFYTQSFVISKMVLSFGESGRKSNKKVNKKIVSHLLIIDTQETELPIRFSKRSTKRVCNEKDIGT